MIRAAVALRMLPREFRERANSEDVTELMAYHLLEPIGDENRQRAKTAAAIANAFGGGKDGKRISEDVFLPVPPRPQTAAEMEQILAAALAPIANKTS
jgi:hypothetical protein